MSKKKKITYNKYKDFYKSWNLHLYIYIFFSTVVHKLIILTQTNVSLMFIETYQILANIQPVI